MITRRVRDFVRLARKYGFWKALRWGKSLERGDQDQEGMVG